MRVTASSHRSARGPQRRGHPPGPGQPAAPEHVVVLSGGGSLGAVQVGMLQTLLAAGVRPGALVGCSVGALNAAYLAQDPTPQRAAALAALWAQLRDRDIFPHSAPRQVAHLLRRDSHLFEPAALRALVERWVPLADLGDLPVPVHVVTTDLVSGAECWWTTGPAVAVLTASACLPGMFPPVPLADSLHVDGGITNLVPVDRALGTGARHVWVLNVAAAPVHRLTDHMSALDVLLTGFALSLRAQRRSADAGGSTDQEVHRVPLGDLGRLAPTSVRDFRHTVDLLEHGRHVMAAYLAAHPAAVAPRPPADRSAGARPGGGRGGWRRGGWRRGGWQRGARSGQPAAWQPVLTS